MLGLAATHRTGLEASRNDLKTAAFAERNQAMSLFMYK